MDHADMVIGLDRKYGWKSPDAVKCPNDGTSVKLKQSLISHKSHGNMVVHKNGQVLVCGVCGETYPTSSVI